MVDLVALPDVSAPGAGGPAGAMTPEGRELLRALLAEIRADEQATKDAADIASGKRKADIPLAEAADLFYADLVSRGSPLTATTYRAAMRRFLRFLSGLPTPPTMASELTIDHAVQYRRALAAEAPKLARGTTFTYSVAATRLYAFLLREGFRQYDDLPYVLLQERMRAVRGKRPQFRPRVPDDEAVAAVIAVARARRGAGTELQRVARLRDLALVEVLRATGARVAEVCGLHRGDLQASDRSALVVGKGDLARRVFMDPPSWEALHAYLAARDAALPGTDGWDAAVFVGFGHNRARQALVLTTKGARDIIRTLVAAAGRRDQRITPHRFRAWFATHVVETTGDLAAAQAFLGHASPETTKHYLGQRSLRAIHDRAFAARQAESGE